MHPRVKAFVEDLQQNPPADLEAWLAEGPEARAAHLREFDLEDLSDPVTLAGSKWLRRYCRTSSTSPSRAGR